MQVSTSIIMGYINLPVINKVPIQIQLLRDRDRLAELWTSFITHISFVMLNPICTVYKSLQ